MGKVWQAGRGKAWEGVEMPGEVCLRRAGCGQHGSGCSVRGNNLNIAAVTGTVILGLLPHIIFTLSPHTSWILVILCRSANLMPRLHAATESIMLGLKLSTNSSSSTCIGQRGRTEQRTGRGQV